MIFQAKKTVQTVLDKPCQKVPKTGKKARVTKNRVGFVTPAIKNCTFCIIIWLKNGVLFLCINHKKYVCRELNRTFEKNMLNCLICYCQILTKTDYP